MLSATESFEQSFQFFLNHEKELMTRYKNKVIAIHIDKVLGVYENVMDAYLKVPKEHNLENGSFVIKNFSESEGRYVRVCYSSSDIR